MSAPVTGAHDKAILSPELELQTIQSYILIFLIQKLITSRVKQGFLLLQPKQPIGDIGPFYVSGCRYEEHIAADLVAYLYRIQGQDIHSSCSVICCQCNHLLHTKRRDSHHQDLFITIDLYEILVWRYASLSNHSLYSMILCLVPDRSRSLSGYHTFD